MSQKFFFGPANFNFDKPAEILRTSFRKKPFIVQKQWKSVCFENYFFPKVFLWKRRMQFQQTRQKNRQGPKTSAQCLKMIENFICFPKQFFFKKCFYRYGECSFDRPAKFFLLNYRNCSEKSRQKMQKLFKNFFCKKFLWRIRKQLESPADFLLDSQPKFFRSIFKK